jgi:hypothetical protein
VDVTAMQQLEKKVKQLKRIANEQAGQLHDLVEERLPAAYEEIPLLAQSTYEACRAWAEANAQLTAIQTQGDIQ